LEVKNFWDSQDKSEFKAKAKLNGLLRAKGGETDELTRELHAA
jgi:hypothetical protein